MKKAYLLSLGCPRNLVDSEVLLGLFKEKNIQVVEEAEEADVAIVNTCGFIEDAKKESIDIILQLADLKKNGKIKKLIVAGCLPQRYPSELLDEISEIDGVFGTSDFIKIPDFIEKLFPETDRKQVASDPEFLYDHLYSREILSSPRSVYVKIQEGCSNRCSYCIIPSLRGPRRSRTIESVISEIRGIRDKYDPKEVLLIGQDTTSFGMDTSGRSQLPELLREVSGVIPERWIRLLYTHPAHFNDELIATIAKTPSICRYIDLPIQHINDRILNDMNRKVTKEDISSLIGKIRREIKGVVIRTSIIVGFPGETEKEFEELISFLSDIRFDRLGAFIYSREEGTPASDFSGQVPREVKERRFDEVMALQQRISAENNSKLIGREIKVLVDSLDPDKPGEYIGRSYMDAPEIDGVVFIKGEDLSPGDFADVRVTGSLEYDLVGELII